MRYGTIVTSGFYGIVLTKREVDLVDGFFLAASHHRIRALNAQDFRTRGFHSALYWKHIQSMMKVIAGGGFTDVFRHPSVTGPGCHRPDGWLRVLAVDPHQVLDPKDYDHLLPSQDLFEQQAADLRFPAGKPHPYDRLLLNPAVFPATIPLDAA